MPGRKSASRRRPVFINAGCGPPNNSRVPAYFSNWRQIRIDVDPDKEPDLVANIADLSEIPDGTIDAVWSAHCVEHLFPHQVVMALTEFRRVLRGNGFACIVVPDVQAIAHWVATDKIDEPIYASAAGPVSAHDMIWGFGPAIQFGHLAMAHHCGFTPTLLLKRLQEAGFAEIVLRRESNLELVALGLTQESDTAERRISLLADLGL